MKPKAGPPVRADAMTVEHDSSAAYDDLNVRSIALVGGVGAVLVFVAIVAVQVIYFRYNEAEHQDKVLAVPNRQANETLAAQLARLEKAGPGADAAKDEKSIPVEEAMALVVAEYRQRQEAGGRADGADPGSAASESEGTPTEAAARQPAPE